MSNAIFYVKKWTNVGLPGGTPEGRWKRIGNFETRRDAYEFIDHLKVTLDDAYEVVTEIHPE